MTTNTEWIDHYEMLPKGTKVLAAVSGGRDSVYLLHWLRQLQQVRNLTIGAARPTETNNLSESCADSWKFHCLWAGAM